MTSPRVLHSRSVLSRLPMYRGRSHRLAEHAQIVQHARQIAQARKARVLAHPDLARRLCKLMGYQRPDQWGGYVPPARLPQTIGGSYPRNDSPYRAGLVEILREVSSRESTSGGV